MPERSTPRILQLYIEACRQATGEQLELHESITIPLLMRNKRIVADRAFDEIDNIPDVGSEHFPCSAPPFPCFWLEGRGAAPSDPHVRWMGSGILCMSMDLKVLDDGKKYEGDAVYATTYCLKGTSELFHMSDHLIDHLVSANEKDTGYIEWVQGCGHAVKDPDALLDAVREKARWIVYWTHAPYVLFKDGRDLIVSPGAGESVCFLDDEGSPIKASITLRTEEKLLPLHTEAHKFLFRTLSIMNCKNTSVVDRPKPPRTKAGTRTGRASEPRFSFSTIVVRPPSGRKKTDSSPSVTTEKRLHICRGHFKDYRTGKGLFGKYKGLFYVPNHMRGSDAAGRVDSDYEVEM